MRRGRFLHLTVVLAGLAGLLYVLISLYLPSPRRLIFGVDKKTGRVRKANRGIAFLPPHQFYRLSFEKREGAAQLDGMIRINSRESVPVRIFYRLRFDVQSARVSDARTLVRAGWSAWIRARVSEAVAAVTRELPVEELSSPADFTRRRDLLRQAVTNHLARSGLNVTAFEIQQIIVDRKALLQFKRAELRRKARGAVGKVVVIQLDGADWELITELVIDERLPNIKALIQGGASGSVQTIQPTISSLLWTTAATGVAPDRHGVIDFFDQKQKEQPVTSVSRRVPAVWDIVDAFGRSAAVVGWWTNWPPVEGSRAAIFDTPVELSEQAVFPRELESMVRRLSIPPGTITFNQVNRFLNITPLEYEEAVRSGNQSDPILMTREVLSKMWTDHRTGVEIYRSTKPSLFMTAFEGTDLVNHLFGPYHPPLREGVDERAFRRYWPAVGNYYAEVDRMIGEWMQAVKPDQTDTTVILMSTHGMQWGSDRPKVPPAGNSALAAHRAPGFLVVYGNRVKPSRARGSFSIYDLTPTILTLLGLPVSNEMPGKFPAWAFDGVTPVEGVNISSYKDLVGDRPVGTGSLIDPKVYRAHLQVIGHVVDQTKVSMPVLRRAQPLTPQQWGYYAYYNNLGVQLKQQKKLKEASEALQEAIEINPGRPIPYLNLSMVLFERQQYAAAEEMFLEAIVRGLPDAEQYLIDYASLYRERDMTARAVGLLTKGRDLFPQSYLISANLGAALAAVNRYAEALPELERALGLRPTSTTVLNNLALFYLKKKDLGRALDYWNRSLAIDPRQPKIREAQAAAQSRV